MQEKDFLGFKNVAVDQSAFRVPDLWPRGIVRALGMMKNVEREIVVRKVGKKWRHESRSKYHLKLGRMMLCTVRPGITEAQNAHWTSFYQRQRNQWKNLPARKIELMFGERRAPKTVGRISF
jgi:hypothetical protein